MPDATCSVRDCPKKAHSRGMCSRHYARWRRGLPLEDPGPRPCAYCEAVFVSTRHDRRYCSSQCERRSGFQRYLVGSRSSTCTECGATFEVPGQRGRVPQRCAPCTEGAKRAALVEWRKANPEKYAAQQERVTPVDPEVMRARSRAWYAANKAQAAKARRAAYLKNREARLAYTMEYKRRNRAHATELENRRRARKLAQFVAPVDPQEIWERDGGACQLCGEPITDPKQRSIDHIIPISRGGTHEPANVQLAHRVCNSRKGNRLQMPA